MASKERERQKDTCRTNGIEERIYGFSEKVSTWERSCDDFFQLNSDIAPFFSLSFFHFQSIFLSPWFVMEQCRFARKLHSDSTAPSCCNRYRNQVFFPLKNVSLFYEHWLKKSFNEEKANKKRTTNVSFVDFEPASNRSMQCGIKLIMFFICASCSAGKKESVKISSSWHFQ